MKGPVANEAGMWAGEWTYSAYISMVRPGNAQISAVDPNLKTLAHAPVVLASP